MALIQNQTYDALKVGDSAEIARTLREDDIALFAAVSGDVNPAHVDPAFAENDHFHKIIAHGMWGGGLISAVLGTELPGPGAVYVSQSLEFLRPVVVGDTITAKVSVLEKRPRGRVLLSCECRNQDGKAVIRGEAEVVAPKERISRERVAPPEVELHRRGARYAPIMAAARDAGAIRTAIVHPVDAASLEGALDARAHGLLEPVLIGPRLRILEAAAAANVHLDGLEIVDTPHSHAAAEKAASLAGAGAVAALMKGALHTDELLSAVLSDGALRTERRLSHVFALDVPSYHKLLFITDAAINIEPNLEEKRDIVQNAIDLCQALGVSTPTVAILAAVETVSSKMRSTIDAAALCKMADRGQITGAVLDGPLAFDNAISKAAAKAKHLVSVVSGNADILIAPDLEAGNMLAKQLIHLAHAEAAGLVIGARVPIMLTSRSDTAAARTASAAIARLFATRRMRSEA